MALAPPDMMGDFEGERLEEILEMRGWRAVVVGWSFGGLDGLRSIKCLEVRSRDGARDIFRCLGTRLVLVKS